MSVYCPYSSYDPPCNIGHLLLRNPIRVNVP